MRAETAVEAALFSAGRALTPHEVADATRLSPTAVTAALERLVERYRHREGALEVAPVGGKYALQLRSEAVTYARQLAPQEVPPHLLRTLALIAHEQPMRQSALKRRLGDRVYEHVRELVELELVSRERSSHTYLLSTTPAFRDYFGIDAGDDRSMREWLEEAVGDNCA